MKIGDSFPTNDGFYMPAEYAAHDACLMIWPERPGSFKKDLTKAHEAFSKVAKAIARSEKVYIFAGHKTIDSARKALAENNNIEIVEVETNDAWARDTGSTFVLGKGKRRGVSWKFNAWGGAYNGLYKDYELDQLVADRICRVVGDDVYDAGDFVLEGGAIHTDGEGTLITTSECLLSPGRNPGLTQSEIEDKLKKYLGVTKIIFLPYGIFNDETDGHVDNFCCFSSPGVIILAWTDDVNDPQYERSRIAYEILSHEKDAKGRSFKIIRLPIPEYPVLITEEDLAGYEFEDEEDSRETGERLAASYVNFYISNKAIIYPVFGGINEKSDEEAGRILKEAFPDREIIGIYARDILVGGGNIHCITQQIPSVWANI